jgi:hypothetical protein
MRPRLTYAHQSPSNEEVDGQCLPSLFTSQSGSSVSTVSDYGLDDRATGVRSPAVQPIGIKGPGEMEFRGPVLQKTYTNLPNDIRYKN